MSRTEMVSPRRRARRSDRHAVDLHLPGLHHPLDAERRVIAEVADEKRIDPHAAEVALDNQFGRERKRAHAPIFTRSIDIRNLARQNGGRSSIDGHRKSALRRRPRCEC